MINFPINPVDGQTHQVGQIVYTYYAAISSWSSIASPFTFDVITDARLIVNNTTTSTSTDSGAVVVAGGVGIGGDLFVGGTVNVGSAGQISSFTSPVTTSSATILADSFPADAFTTAKYFCQAFDGSAFQVEEIILVHDNQGPATEVYILQYALSTNGGELGAWDAAYVAGDIQLQFTPNYLPTALTVSAVRTLIAV